MQRVAVVVVVVTALAAACGGQGRGSASTEPADPVVARLAAAADASCACTTFSCATAAEHERSAWAEAHRAEVERARAEPARAAQLDRDRERAERCWGELAVSASAAERAAVAADREVEVAIVLLSAHVERLCLCRDVTCAEQAMRAIFGEDEPEGEPTKEQWARLARLADRLFTCQQRLAITSAQLALWRESKAERARAIARRLAFEAYPQWTMRPSNQGRCPTLAELVVYLDEQEPLVDPWGHPYQLRCGADLPAGARGLAVYSLGADGRDATPDDVRSWE